MRTSSYTTSASVASPLQWVLRYCSLHHFLRSLHSAPLVGVVRTVHALFFFLCQAGPNLGGRGGHSPGLPPVGAFVCLYWLAQWYVNKDLTFKAKDKDKDQTFKAKDQDKD